MIYELFVSLLLFAVIFMAARLIYLTFLRLVLRVIEIPLHKRAVKRLRRWGAGVNIRDNADICRETLAEKEVFVNCLAMLFMTATPVIFVVANNLYGEGDGRIGHFSFMRSMAIFAGVFLPILSVTLTESYNKFLSELFVVVFAGKEDVYFCYETRMSTFALLRKEPMTFRLTAESNARHNPYFSEDDGGCYLLILRKKGFFADRFETQFVPLWRED